jgi:hypothetical protein
MASASRRSRSVTVLPASCEVSSMVTVFHTFDQLGGGPSSPASSATRLMNAHASLKLPNSELAAQATVGLVPTVRGHVGTSVITSQAPGRRL